MNPANRKKSNRLPLLLTALLVMLLGVSFAHPCAAQQAGVTDAGNKSQPNQGSSDDVVGGSNLAVPDTTDQSADFLNAGQICAEGQQNTYIRSQ